MASQPVLSTSAPLDESLVGKRVEKYEIVRLVGRGGMGTVYEAINTTINKRVAMKFVDASSARSKEAVARFRREAEAASAVESAHIVDIFDSGVTESDLPFIVMELLRGEDLGHRIKRCGRLEIPEALHIVAQILRGLHRAHEAGIVHRDLKPDNIFLVDRDDDPNFVKILDFGISKFQKNRAAPVQTLTRQGTVLGTPFYMSPEQAQALPDIDGRTDLWSVGAILYECLTGRPPHSGGSYEQVIVNICMHDAEDVRASNPAVPEALAQVIAKALTRDRDERFATARAFLEALKALSSELFSTTGATPSNDASFAGLISNDFRLTPRSADRTPQPAATPSPEALATAPTLANPEPLGARPNLGESGRRERRAFILVALGAMLVGGLAAAFVVKSREGHAQIEPPAPITTLSQTPPAAQTAPSIEAATSLGSAPAESASTPVPQASAQVSAQVPGVSPAPKTTPSVEPFANKPPIPRGTPPVAKTAAPKASSAPSLASSAPPPPPQPSSTGVAGQLQLKTE